MAIASLTASIAVELMKISHWDGEGSHYMPTIGQSFLIPLILVSISLHSTSEDSHFPSRDNIRHLPSGAIHDRRGP